jgi:hypothetical protein
LRKTKILVIGPPTLSRIIEHLFRNQPEFEVAGSLSDVQYLAREADRLQPDLIVANVKPVNVRICRMVASIKRSSPLSKLILVCPLEDLSRAARRCGADAYLNDEKLTSQLLIMARTLSDRPKVAKAGS